MISDDNVRQLFKNARNFLTNQQWDHNKPLNTQFFRGVAWGDPLTGGCRRYIMVFDRFNIIPKYCFNCYKVLIEPQTVVELFKLMVLFEKLKLPDDNPRKCMVESREQVSGAYKGFIYCKSIDEGEKIIELVKKELAINISKNIPVTLKRGCSEFALAYPEWAQIGQDPTMEYKEEWQEYEDIIDKELVINPRAKDTYNNPGYTLHDAQAMLVWLKYAKKTGDLSYLKISRQPLPSFQNEKHSSPLHPQENNKMKATPKIGRNSPCICGSGKKYKRCCGR